MAGKRREKIDDRDVTGLKYFDKLAPLLKRLREVGIHAQTEGTTLVSFASRDGDLDEADYGACVRLAEEAGYKGPYTLIFDSEIPPEWNGLSIERDFVTSLEI